MNNYNTAVSTLQSTRQRIAEFDKFIQTAENSPECKFCDVESFLIEPVQRLPRYEILLKELIKNTNYNHCDYEALLKALTKIEASVKFINAQQKNYEYIMELLKKIEGDVQALKLITRRYLMEGPVKLKYKGKFHRRTMVLFTNLILICKEVSTKQHGSVYKYLEHITIDNNLTVDIMDGRLFTIKTALYEYEFGAESDSDKKTWTDALENSLQYTCTLRSSTNQSHRPMKKRIIISNVKTPTNTENNDKV